MATWIEPPPARRGMGCFGKGCLILVAFLVLLIVAFVAGGYFAVRHVKNTYLPTEPLVLPTSDSGDVEASDETAQSGSQPGPTAPTGLSRSQAAKQNWEAFTDAAKEGRPARLELSAAELNALLAEPGLRGKFHVSIEGNAATLRTSIPMKDMPVVSPLFADRYLNGEMAVVASAERTIESANVRNITINGQNVPLGMLDAQFQSRSIRSLARDFAEEYHITLFDIADGKLILEANGRR